MSLLGAIEAGGTKFICAVGNESGDINRSITIATTTPEETLNRAIQFFKEVESQLGKIEALGIGCFGPIDRNNVSPNYGKILNTPKIAWQQFNLYNYLQAELQVPIKLETDVNAAVLGESKFGVAKDCKHLVYVTVGTGIGAGVLSNGEVLNGVLHPELGHIPVARYMGDNFSGSCPFHADCLEGMASGSAIKKREQLLKPNTFLDDTFWLIEAHYLAQLCITITCVLAPEKIVFGGGVLNKSDLLQKIRVEFLRLSAGYFSHVSEKNISEYIVLSGAGGIAGLRGAFLLAHHALIEK